MMKKKNAICYCTERLVRLLTRPVKIGNQDKCRTELKNVSHNQLNIQNQPDKEVLKYTRNFKASTILQKKDYNKQEVMEEADRQNGSRQVAQNHKPTEQTVGGRDIKRVLKLVQALICLSVQKSKRRHNTNPANLSNFNLTLSATEQNPRGSFGRGGSNVLCQCIYAFLNHLKVNTHKII